MLQFLWVAQAIDLTRGVYHSHQNQHFLSNRFFKFFYQLWNGEVLRVGQ